MAEHCFFCGHLLLGEEGCEVCGTVRHAVSERRVRAPCPRCGAEARLVPFGVGEAALQACPRCKGMFASAPDWDTLLDVFTQEPLPDVVIHEIEGEPALDPYRSAPSSRASANVDLEAEVRCPTCASVMERLEFAAISRVIIDVCPEHGVWLDAGELERVIERVQPHPHAEPIPVLPDVVPANAPRAYVWHPEPKTMAEAARMPPEPPTHDEEERFDRPLSEPVFIPPTHENRGREHVPWTTQLGRALGALVKMIVNR